MSYVSDTDILKPSAPCPSLSLPSLTHTLSPPLPPSPPLQPLLGHRLCYVIRMLYHAIPCHTIPCHTMPHHVLPYHAIPCLSQIPSTSHPHLPPTRYTHTRIPPLRPKNSFRRRAATHANRKYSYASSHHVVRIPHCLSACRPSVLSLPREAFASLLSALTSDIPQSSPCYSSQSESDIQGSDDTW